jgi:hypothetical protein
LCVVYISNPLNLLLPFCTIQIIARIGDGSRFHEFKQLYAPTIVTGFTNLYGMQIGIVANNGILYSESALKVRHTVPFSYLSYRQRAISILFSPRALLVCTRLTFIDAVICTAGGALHRAVLRAQGAPALPAEHHGLHGWPQVRERG